MFYPVRSRYILIILAYLCICCYSVHKPCYLFSQKQASQIYQQKSPALILLLGKQDQSSPVFETVSNLSNQYQNVLFTYSRIGSDPYYKLLEFLGVQRLQAPIIVFVNSAADKFLYSVDKFGPINRINVKLFISKVNENFVEPFLKSRDSTEEGLSQMQLDQNKLYMKYYNSYTLRDELEYSQKQLLIVIYGTWCVYSERLSPEFTQVAKRLRYNPNIMFGKIDGYWNQIKGFQVEGYPTIALFRTDREKPPAIYKGKRVSDEIIRWVSENTEYQWVQPQPQQVRIKIKRAQQKEAAQANQETQLDQQDDTIQYIQKSIKQIQDQLLQRTEEL